MRVFGGVRHHLRRRPLHVGAQRRAKLGVIGQPGVVGGLHEARDEAIAKVTVCALTGMDTDHPGVTAAILGKALGSTENLGPVVGKPLHMLWVARMREGMVQDGVGKAALVMRGGQCQNGRFAAREFEKGRACHRSRLAR